MNTLSRLDSLLSRKARRGPPATPPPEPSVPASSTAFGAASSAAGPSSPASPAPLSLHPPGLAPSPIPRRRLSALPPTPSRVRRRGRGGRAGAAPTVASLQLPPPTTPLLLRIALALWSILLAFWRALVVETRAERKRRQRRGTLTSGARRGGDHAAGAAGAGGSGSGSASEGDDAGSASDDDRADGWVDPVTRAPAGMAVDEPHADEFAPRHPPDGVTFRLRSAAGGSGTGGDGAPRTPPPSSSPHPFQRQPSPPSILSNPLRPAAREREVTPPRAADTATVLSARDRPTPTRQASGRLLPNPMSTSLLDPSVPVAPTRASPGPHELAAHAAAAAPRMAASPGMFQQQKTLILDLDETLIHSTSRPLGGVNMGGGLLGLSSGLFGGRRSRRGEGHTVEVVLHGRSTTYHVYKRPFVDFFLKKVAPWYTLVIYTASMPEYADPVIDWLDNGRGLFAKKLYRDSCFLQPNGSYIKDLALVEPDLSRVCFMDNSPISYSWNKEGWTSDPYDEALLQSIPVLDSLRFVNDIRRVLGIRGFS